MAYQILALDLDGTLTNSQKEITKPTLDALIEIQKAGKKVVLASGRPTKGVVPLAEQLHLEDYGSYILSFNGGRITDCRTKKAIYNKILPADCAKGVYETVIKYAGHGVDILTYTSEHILSGIHSNTQSWSPASIRCRSLMPVLTFWMSSLMIRINSS